MSSVDIDSEVRSELSSLGVRDLRRLVKGVLRVPGHPPLSKTNLLDYILCHASTEAIELLRNSARQHQIQKESVRLQKSIERKRKRIHLQSVARKAARLIEGADSRNRNVSRYMELPSQRQVHQCYREFYQATSNAALTLMVCAVCAREVNRKQDCVVKIKLTDLPNRDRLRPARPHPAHDLFDGSLLDPNGVEHDADGTTYIAMCNECRRELIRSRQNRCHILLQTTYGLDVYLGSWRGFTLPEQQLIALLYPRVFVFKLSAKSGYQKNATLQRGMRATVSTYELDVEGVASMVQGNLMPRPVSILSSIISVTFIGRGKLTMQNLRKLFWVRRQVVFEDLVWLKHNNPEYYGQIDIDPNRLRQLPDDDVPIEIAAIVRQTTDEGLIDQESAGYVPNPREANLEDAADGEQSFCIRQSSHLTTHIRQPRRYPFGSHWHNRHRHVQSQRSRDDPSRHQKSLEYRSRRGVCCSIRSTPCQ